MRSDQDFGMSFEEVTSICNPVWEKINRHVKRLAENIDEATPAEFLLCQFELARGTQIIDTCSNALAGLISSTSNSIRNQRSS